MTDPLKIEFEMIGHGWAKCSLHFGGQPYEMNGVSYCTDALGDIVRVAVLMVTGHHAGRLSFDAEPMEWRWVLNRHWQDDANLSREGLRLRILTFQDIYAEQPDDQGAPEFEAICEPEEFARAVVWAASKVWEEVGAEVYAKTWRGIPFPSRALAALKAALDLPPDLAQQGR